MPVEHLHDLCRRYIELLRLALPDDVVAARATGRVLPSDVGSPSIPEETFRAMCDVYDEFVREYGDEMVASVPSAPRHEVDKRAREFFVTAVSRLPDDDMNENTADLHRRDVTPGSPEWREEVEDHLSRHLGECLVLHEPPCGGRHIDVRIFEATPERPYLTAVTVGVSERPMAAPDDEPERRHQEFMIYLPEGWTCEPNTGEAAEWPFWLLKNLAAFVDAEETYFAPRHSVALSNPPQPFAPRIPFTTAFLLWPPETSPFDELTIDGTPCRFLWVVPLTPAEADYKLIHGSSALLQRSQEANIELPVDPNRACAITGGRPPFAISQA